MRDALRLALAGRYEEAVAVFDADPPSEPRLRCHHARCAFEVGRDDDASRIMGEALQSGASIPYVLASDAVLSLDRGEVARGREGLRRALSLDPSNVLLPSYEALAQFMEGDQGPALAALEARLLPASPGLLSRVARELELFLGPGRESFSRFVLEAEEDPEPAVFEAINNILVLPDRLASWLHVTLFARSRLPEARALAEAGRRHRAGDYRGAATYLAAQREKVAGEELPHALAEALLLAGDGEAALELLPEPPPLPGDPPADVRLEWIYRSGIRAAALFRAERLDDASELLERVERVGDADDYTLPYLHGLVLLARGEGRGARRRFEAAFHLQCPFLAAALVKSARDRLAA